MFKVAQKKFMLALMLFDFFPAFPLQECIFYLFLYRFEFCIFAKWVLHSMFAQDPPRPPVGMCNVLQAVLCVCIGRSAVCPVSSAVTHAISDQGGVVQLVSDAVWL